MRLPRALSSCRPQAHRPPRLSVLSSRKRDSCTDSIPPGARAYFSSALSQFPQHLFDASLRAMIPPVVQDPQTDGKSEILKLAPLPQHHHRDRGCEQNLPANVAVDEFQKRPIFRAARGDGEQFAARVVAQFPRKLSGGRFACPGATGAVALQFRLKLNPYQAPPHLPVERGQLSLLPYISRVSRVA